MGCKRKTSCQAATRVHLEATSAKTSNANGQFSRTPKRTSRHLALACGVMQQLDKLLLTTGAFPTMPLPGC
jgi:hypothetical protein